MQEWEFKWAETKHKLQDLVASRNLSLEKVSLSFSGGKDSTVMLKLVEELGWKNKIKIVFFDTRMEYQATYDFVEQKKQEGWNIETTYPTKPAPLIYKEDGYPLVSKKASEMISRLQKQNFDWKDTYKDLDYLRAKYPKCKAAVRWLHGDDLRFLKCSKKLKRVLALGLLDFKVANKCCEYLKKKPVYEYNKEHGIELAIIGLRKAEGGVRTEAYEGCIFEDKLHNVTKFFPLWWLTDTDMQDIIEAKTIELSKCYTLYGLTRTGCVGCPFGANYNEELAILEKYEPNKALAVKNLFGKSYAFMNQVELHKKDKD